MSEPDMIERVRVIHTQGIIDALRAWAPLVASGYEVPAASRPMLEAALLLEASAAIGVKAGLEMAVAWHAAEISTLEERMKENLAYLVRTGDGRNSSLANEHCQSLIINHRLAMDALLRKAAALSPTPPEQKEKE